MIRVSAPGLAPWPPLMFDSEKRLATVSAHFANWHSYGWGHFVTECLVWLTGGVATIVVGRKLSIADPGERIVVAILGGIVIMIVAAFFLRALAPGFLARQFFANRLKVYFSEEAIAFQSGLYEEPVVVWRNWNDQPVTAQFHIRPDADAREYSSSLDYKQRKGKEYLNDAILLELLLATTCKTQANPISQPETIRRSFPIAQLDQRDAARFTTVLTAAAALTCPENDASQTGKRGGVDIDIA